jgi:hypothetical protein
VRDTVFSRVRIAVVAGCVLAVGLIIAGCGGGSSSTGASGSAPLSQGDFVSQANAVCKESNDKVAALPALPPNPDLKTVGNLAAQEIPIANEAYSRLRAITPPSNLQDKYNQFLASGKATIAAAGQLADAAKSGDTSQAKAAAQKLSVGNQQGDALAKSLGLDECAKNVSPQG